MHKAYKNQTKVYLQVPKRSAIKENYVDTKEIERKTERKIKLFYTKV